MNQFKRGSRLSLYIGVAAVALCLTQPIAGQTLDQLQRDFQNPPADARIMMRWWWFGPAVTKPQLEREMRLMKEGGIGGFEVQPVYPLVPDDDKAGIKNLPYLSDEFIDALRFTAMKAHELGLRMDLTLGSGWPYGGPQVPIDQAAGRLRYEHVKIDPATLRVKVPYVGAGEELVNVFLARTTPQGFDKDSLQQITDISDGMAHLPAGIQQSSEVLFFIASRTGMQVKRPAVGAEGFVLDHLDRSAIDSYLHQVGDRLMQAFDKNPPYAIFCDSLEVYNNDWTGNILEEFKQRRGYDLRPLLPALVADIGPKTAVVRHDWGLTLTELLNEHFLGPMRDWSKRNKVLFRIQDYGVPAATLASNAYADLPEGEGAQWKSLSSTRWASSASHIYGHQITSSETWTWLHSPTFRATPLDLKAEADRHFLQGINQLIGHGWPYTAEGIEYPGWRFYAAAVFNEKNPWWIVMPDISRYLQRLSFLLRQGQPANDVAIYLPNHDAWSTFTADNIHMIDALRKRVGPDVISQVLDAGFNFDCFDDETLKQNGRIEKGELVLGEHRYKAVVLPNVDQIPPDTYTRLEQFALAGGVLVATRRLPATAPGMQSQPNDSEKIVALSKSLFQTPAGHGHFVADEKTLATRLPEWLNPDLKKEPSANDLGFVHRHTEDAEIYFIANTSNQRLSTRAMFRVKAMHPEWWSPFTGDVSPGTIEKQDNNGVAISVDLEPYGSRVLVFTGRSLPQAKINRSPSAGIQSVNLSTGWRVSFGTGTAVSTMEELRSWTDNEQTRFFSGVATYEKEFIAPEAMLRPSMRLRLEFGAGQAVPVEQTRNGMQAWFDAPIREAAVVYLNDQRVGSLWCPPYALDFTGLLKSGTNRIRIDVANTAINYMAGHSPPDYRLLNLRYGERFQAQDMDKVQPIPSGLLGPINLTVSN